jgi:hypothetical protein
MVSFHDPFPKKELIKIIEEPIPILQEENTHWRLKDLNISQLRTIKEWAITNRDGTDKRLLPSAIFFALLGILSNTEAFQNILETFYIWIRRIILPGTAEGLKSEEISNFVVQYFVVIIVLGILFGFITSLLSLFRNLVAQSLIIEACILTEYTIKESQSVSIPRRKGFLAWLTRALFFYSQVGFAEPNLLLLRILRDASLQSNLCALRASVVPLSHALS